MRILSTKEAVENFMRVLILSGKKVETAKWQTIDVQTSMLEVCDLFVKMKMVPYIAKLAGDVKADLPWAEDHFLERLAGSSNPGKQYKNWPYWKVDGKFMEGEKFSHTYQERFWPPFIKGIRYNAGNWQDIKERLSSDTTTRQTFFSIWHPEDQSNNCVRVPCTIGYWFTVRNGLLNVTYLIRSCDARRHLRNDIYMTQRLAQEMLLHLQNTGHDIELGTMSMWVGSLHCFESDRNYLIKK